MAPSTPTTAATAGDRRRSIRDESSSTPASGASQSSEPRREVIAKLGRPAATLTLSPSRQAGVDRALPSQGAPFLVTYDSTGHVVSAETYSSSFRTRAGLGPGSSLARASRLPGFARDSCELGYWNGNRRTGRRAVVTVFTPDGGDVASVIVTQLRVYTACAASPRKGPAATVAVDRAIGKVSLGMRERRVVDRLGAPGATRAVTLRGGAAGRLARYSLYHAPFLVTYDSGGLVVAIKASSPIFFAPAGIGPGAPIALVRGLHAFRLDPCRRVYWNRRAGPSPGDAVTVFGLGPTGVTSVLLTVLRLFTGCSAGSSSPGTG